jgi:hypothetical protein
MVSLFSFLSLHFKGARFTGTSKVIPFRVRSWALWSNKPLAIGDIQEELTLELSIKILSMAVPEECYDLVTTN